MFKRQYFLEYVIDNMRNSVNVLPTQKLIFHVYLKHKKYL